MERVALERWKLIHGVTRSETGVPCLVSLPNSRIRSPPGRSPLPTLHLANIDVIATTTLAHKIGIELSFIRSCSVSRTMPKDPAAGVLYVASPRRKSPTRTRSELRPPSPPPVPSSPSVWLSLLLLLPILTIWPWWCKNLHYDLPTPVTNG